MDEGDRLSATIGLIAEASLVPERWNEALGAVAGVLNARFATLETFEQGTFRHLAFRASELPPGILQDYLDHYAAISPRVTRGLRPSAPALLYDQLLIDEAEMDHDPYYQEFLAPEDLRYFLSGCVQRDRRTQTIVTVQRGARTGHVTPEEIGVMERLLPHINRSADLARRLSGTVSNAMRGSLDWLGDAVAVLSPEETVVYANAAMEHIFSAGDGITLASGTLRMLDPAAASSLAAAVGAIRRNRLDPLAPLHATDLVVARPSGAAPYVVAVRALPGLATDTLYLAADPLAIVFVRDPEPRTPSVHPPIRNAFALTEAESRLAGALRQGISPHDYADAHGLSRNTVYTHLRRLKEKLGCHSTTGLVCLLGSLHPPFDGA